MPSSSALKVAALPALAGQPEPYLRTQIGLFKSGRRGGTPYADVMHAVARNLEAEQIRDVAEYYASLAPASPVNEATRN